MRDFVARLGVVGELLQFLWKRKLFWLIPMILTLLVVVLLIIASSAGGLLPFIYSVI